MDQIKYPGGAELRRGCPLCFCPSSLCPLRLASRTALEPRGISNSPLGRLVETLALLAGQVCGAAGVALLHTGPGHRDGSCWGKPISWRRPEVSRMGSTNTHTMLLSPGIQASTLSLPPMYPGLGKAHGPAYRNGANGLSILASEAAEAPGRGCRYKGMSWIGWCFPKNARPPRTSERNLIWEWGLCRCDDLR